MQGAEIEDEGSVLTYMTKSEIEEQRSSLLIMTQRPKIWRNSPNSIICKERPVPLPLTSPNTFVHLEYTYLFAAFRKVFYRKGHKRHCSSVPTCEFLQFPPGFRVSLLIQRGSYHPKYNAGHSMRAIQVTFRRNFEGGCRCPPRRAATGYRGTPNDPCRLSAYRTCVPIVL